MDWTDCELVEVVPGKVSGVPILKGSHVQADSIVENAESGESVDDIAYNFDLDPKDIRKVLAYASSRQPVEPGAPRLDLRRGFSATAVTKFDEID